MSKHLSAQYQNVLEEMEEKYFTTDDEIRIAILGKTGAGKSETGNTILGQKEFKYSSSATSTTKCCSRREIIKGDKKVILIDTPGLCDTDENITPEDTKKEIVKCVGIAAPGVHCFLVVIPIGKFTKEESQAIQHIIKLFGKNAQRYLIVVFTKIDQLDGGLLSAYIDQAPPSLKKFLSYCDMRHVGFNNTEQGEQRKQQVSDLFKSIEHMVSENGGKCYTNKMFEEAERQIQEFMKKKKEEKLRIELERKENLRRQIKVEQEKEQRKKLEQELQNMQIMLKKDPLLAEKIMEEESRKIFRDMVQDEDESILSKFLNFITFKWLRDQF